MLESIRGKLFWLMLWWNIFSCWVISPRNEMFYFSKGSDEYKRRENECLTMWFALLKWHFLAMRVLFLGVGHFGGLRQSNAIPVSCTLFYNTWQTFSRNYPVLSFIIQFLSLLNFSILFSVFFCVKWCEVFFKGLKEVCLFSKVEWPYRSALRESFPVSNVEWSYRSALRESFPVSNVEWPYRSALRESCFTAL